MAAIEATSALMRAGLAPMRAPDGVRAPEATGDVKPDGEGFGDALTKALDAVNTDLKAADAGVNKVARAEPVELHEVMMNLEKADVSVRLMTLVGKRVVSAYREIMRMNV